MLFLIRRVRNVHQHPASCMIFAFKDDVLNLCRWHHTHLSSPPVFSEVRVTQSLVFCVMFSFDHCVVCLSSITASGYPSQGRSEARKCLGYFVWKIIFFPILGGARRVRPPLDPPLRLVSSNISYTNLNIIRTCSFRGEDFKKFRQSETRIMVAMFLSNQNAMRKFCIVPHLYY